MLDSALLVSASLDDLIKDLHVGKCKEGLSTRQIFPKTFQYICEQKQFSVDQFEMVATEKISQPFEAVTGFAFLKETRSVPPKEAFISRLKGETDINDPGFQKNYDSFKKVWINLNIRSLAEFFEIYASTGLLISFFFHFSPIFSSFY